MLNILDETVNGELLGSIFRALEEEIEDPKVVFRKLKKEIEIKLLNGEYYEAEQTIKRIDTEPNIFEFLTKKYDQFSDIRAKKTIIDSIRGFDKEQEKEFLLNILDETVNENLLKSIFWALEAEEIEDPKIIDKALEYVDTSDVYLKLRLIDLFIHLRDKRSVEPLIKYVSDKDSSVRADSIRALGLIGDPRALDVMIKALEDPDDHVVSRVKNYIGHIPGGKEILDKKEAEKKKKLISKHWSQPPTDSALLDIIYNLEKSREPAYKNDHAEISGFCFFARDGMKRALEVDNIPVFLKFADQVVDMYYHHKQLEGEKFTWKSEENIESSVKKRCLGPLEDAGLIPKIKGLDPDHTILDIIS